MDIVEIIKKFDSINVWTRGDQRAPNKPLLILIALSKVQQGEGRLLGFDSYEEQLRELLEQFGPQRKSYHPEYPFWRLQNDSVWEVESEGPLRARDSNTDPPITELRQSGVKGGFKSDIYDLLSKDNKLIGNVASDILTAHFEESLHDDILSSVGITSTIPIKRKRNPQFRADVIRVYQHKCAICAYDVRLGNSLVGIEAAHIKWVAAQGPDEVTNGIALCTLHHKAFDRGAISISRDYKLLVSENVIGAYWAEKMFRRYSGKPIILPINSQYYPYEAYISWHLKEVFRPPALGANRGGSSRLR